MHFTAYVIRCENAGNSILDQFPEVGKLVDGGVAPREKIDYELSRYACYLIVQNGDPRKELEVGQKILDYMGSTELIVNLFRISQTEEKLRKDKVQGAEAETSVHYNVGKEVRSAIEKIGGTMPEDLPTPEKSIQQIEKEQMARLKAKAKKGNIMLDE